MAIGDDFAISIAKAITYTGGGTNYSVLQFHRWLQDKADDALAAGDDLVDITATTPSDRSTDNIITLINGYNINDAAAEHLFDGSITQAGGNTIYAGLVVVGAVPGGTNLQVVQSNVLLTSYWGTGLNADAANNILLRIMVKTRENGVNIDGQRLRVVARELGDTFAEFSLTMGLGNNTAAIFTGIDLNNQTVAGTIATWTSIVNIEGFQSFDVTGDAINEDYYSQWDLGTQTINDLYERTKWIQRRTTAETIHGMNGALFRGITHQWNYDAEAGTGPATNDTIAWGLFVTYDNEVSGPFVVGEAVSIGGLTTVGRILALDDNGVDGTMVIAIEVNGTPANDDQIASIAGTATADVNGAPVGQTTGGGLATILAVDDQGTTGTVWVQLLNGTLPADNAICYDSLLQTNTLTVDGSITVRTLSTAFIGVSTGSAIIGAFGIGIDPADLTASDQLFDLTNVLRLPPNNVTFTVGGLTIGEDRVLVTTEDGASGLDYDQLSLQNTETGAAVATLQMSATIPTDTPSPGTIRVQDDSGYYRRIPFTSFATDTFTLTATENFSVVNATAGNNVFISYIDKLAAAVSEAFTVVFNAPRTLFIRVRDGDTTPIKTFETTGVLGSGGGSTTAIRTPDA